MNKKETVRFLRNVSNALKEYHKEQDKNWDEVFPADEFYQSQALEDFLSSDLRFHFSYHHFTDAHSSWAEVRVYGSLGRGKWGSWVISSDANFDCTSIKSLCQDILFYELEARSIARRLKLKEYEKDVRKCHLCGSEETKDGWCSDESCSEHTKHEKRFVCPHCGEKHETLRYEAKATVVGDYDIEQNVLDEDENIGQDTRYYCPDCEKEIDEEDITKFRESLKKER